jgi:hypothetical protein
MRQAIKPVRKEPDAEDESEKFYLAAGDARLRLAGLNSIAVSAYLTAARLSSLTSFIILEAFFVTVHRMD